MLWPWNGFPIRACSLERAQENSLQMDEWSLQVGVSLLSKSLAGDQCVKDNKPNQLSGTSNTSTECLRQIYCTHIMCWHNTHSLITHFDLLSKILSHCSCSTGVEGSCPHGKTPYQAAAPRILCPCRQSNMLPSVLRNPAVPPHPLLQFFTSCLDAFRKKILKQISVLPFPMSLGTHSMLSNILLP